MEVTDATSIIKRHDSDWPENPTIDFLRQRLEQSTFFTDFRFEAFLPNERIKGLELGFRVSEQGGSSYRLAIRLVDGDSGYCRYHGWCKIGDYEKSELVDFVCNIVKGLESRNYYMNLVLDSDSCNPPLGGQDPYYRIEKLVVGGKTLFEERR